MSPSPLTSKRLIVCILINLFATPGLGSWIARRKISGAGQLLLALLGCGLIIVWLCNFVYRATEMAMGDTVSQNTRGWMLTGGIILFAISWVWTFFTCIALLIEMRNVVRWEKQNVPPKISGP